MPAKPNQVCWLPFTSMARPKSASFTQAFCFLLARNERRGQAKICFLIPGGCLIHVIPKINRVPKTSKFSGFKSLCTILLTWQ